MTTLVPDQYIGIGEHRATLGSSKSRCTQATRMALDVSRIVPAAPHPEGRGGILHIGRLLLYSHGHLHLPLGTQLCAPGLGQLTDLHMFDQDGVRDGIGNSTARGGKRGAVVTPSGVMNEPLGGGPGQAGLGPSRWRCSFATVWLGLDPAGPATIADWQSRSATEVKASRCAGPTPRLVRPSRERA
jgi:hypothetical protein